MHRKDYIEIAAVLRNEYASAGHVEMNHRYEVAKERRETVTRITDALCEKFAVDNPAFDRTRFIDAVVLP